MKKGGTYEGKENQNINKINLWNALGGIGFV